MNQKDVIIKVDRVSKVFRLPNEKNNSLKSAVVNFYKRNKSYEIQQALHDVSFEVRKGEFFGIVGRNGSGKSTLLKIMAGIYAPTEGKVELNGNLTPFIELGVGFNPELTGKENIFLNGALMGFSRSEIKAMYKDIVSFAELRGFMNQKLKNFSSGMQVRLAFSIAVRAQSDILLIDEVLAVGDASFQQKCYDKFEQIIDEGRTVVLVTHDMSAIQRFCNRAVFIEKGVVEMIGKPSEIADKYLEQNLKSDTTKKENGKEGQNQNLFIKDIVLSNERGPAKNFGLREEIILSFKLINKYKDSGLRVGLQVFSNTGAYCFGTNSKVSKVPVFSGDTNNLTIRMKQTLGPGTYYINLALMNKNASKVLRYLPKVEIFNIRQETEEQGVTLITTVWDVGNV